MPLFSEDKLARLFQQTRDERDKVLQELAQARKERDEARRLLADCYRVTGEDTAGEGPESPYVWRDAADVVLRACEERNALQDFHDQICLALGLSASFGEPRVSAALAAIRALRGA